MFTGIEFVLDFIRYIWMLQLGALILTGEETKVSRKAVYGLAVVNVILIYIKSYFLNPEAVGAGGFIMILAALVYGYSYKYVSGRSLVLGLASAVFIELLSTPVYLAGYVYGQSQSVLDVDGLSKVYTVLSTPYYAVLLFAFKRRWGQVLAPYFKKTIEVLRWPLAIIIVGYPISFMMHSFASFKDMLYFEYIAIYLSSAAVFIVVLLYMLSKLRSLQNQLREQNDNLTEYTQTVDKLHSDIRIYKHDVANIMLSMRLMVEKGDFDALDAYFSEHVEGVSGFDLKAYNMLVQMKALRIDSVKGLLFNKFQRALALGVTFEAGIIDTLENLQMKDVDLCRSVGILVDNAIEAALESEKKLVMVFFEKIDGVWTIRVENSYNSSQLNLNRTGSWKTSKGKGRGIGLKSLKMVVKKYSHVKHETLVEGNRVVQSLIFQM